MPMYDIKDSGDVRLDSNATNGDQMLKAVRVGKITATNNKTRSQTYIAPRLPLYKRIALWVAGNFMALLIGAAGGCIGTIAAQLITARFALPH